MEFDFKKVLAKDFVFWYMIVSPIVITTLVLMNYKHPEFGFSGEGYGQGVAILFLFPLIWVMIYVFCKYIEFKNARIAELEENLENQEEIA